MDGNPMEVPRPRPKDAEIDNDSNRALVNGDGSAATSPGAIAAASAAAASALITKGLREIWQASLLLRLLTLALHILQLSFIPLNVHGVNSVNNAVVFGTISWCQNELFATSILRIIGQAENTENAENQENPANTSSYLTDASSVGERRKSESEGGKRRRMQASKRNEDSTEEEATPLMDDPSVANLLRLNLLIVLFGSILFFGVALLRYWGRRSAGHAGLSAGAELSKELADASKGVTEVAALISLGLHLGSALIFAAYFPLALEAQRTGLYAERTKIMTGSHFVAACVTLACVAGCSFLFPTRSRVQLQAAMVAPGINIFIIALFELAVFYRLYSKEKARSLLTVSMKRIVRLTDVAETMDSPTPTHARHTHVRQVEIEMSASHGTSATEKGFSKTGATERAVENGAEIGAVSKLRRLPLILAWELKCRGLFAIVRSRFSRFVGRYASPRARAFVGCEASNSAVKYIATQAETYFLLFYVSDTLKGAVVIISGFLGIIPRVLYSPQEQILFAHYSQKKQSIHRRPSHETIHLQGEGSATSSTSSTSSTPSTSVLNHTVGSVSDATTQEQDHEFLKPFRRIARLQVGLGLATAVLGPHFAKAFIVAAYGTKMLPYADLTRYYCLCVGLMAIPGVLDAALGGMAAPQWIRLKSHVDFLSIVLLYGFIVALIKLRSTGETEKASAVTNDHESLERLAWKIVVIVPLVMRLYVPSQYLRTRVLRRRKSWWFSLGLDRRFLMFGALCFAVRLLLPHLHVFDFTQGFVPTRLNERFYLPDFAKAGVIGLPALIYLIRYLR